MTLTAYGAVLGAVLFVLMRRTPALRRWSWLVLVLAVGLVLLFLAGPLAFWLVGHGGPVSPT